MSDQSRPDAAFRIPAGLREWSRDHGSGALQDWLSRLPDAVRTASAHWNLSLGSPFEPGGTSAWVAPAVTAAGQEVVLKVAWRHDESRDEALGLALVDGEGAVRMLESHMEDDTAAMVLERCSPGTELRLSSTSDQHTVIAAILASVRSVSVPSDAGLRALAEMCDDWAAAATDRYRYMAVGTDPGLVSAGLELFRELPRSASETTLLFTDLHAGNVLAAQRKPWLAIDPKPYLGDPHFDAIQHLLNCPTLAEEPGRLADAFASASDLDAARVRMWLFARCVVEGAEWPQLLAVARTLAP